MSVVQELIIDHAQLEIPSLLFGDKSLGIITCLDSEELLHNTTCESVTLNDRDNSIRTEVQSQTLEKHTGTP